MPTNETTATTEKHEISAAPQVATTEAYEAPELVRVEEARKLLLGNVYTHSFVDYGGYGTNQWGHGR